MNYLAHLHIADSLGSSLLGNLMGDFVKGSPDGKYSLPLCQGIRLHRHVDSTTDQHPLVLALKADFPPALRRFAPIALDMFWDHCLAKHWGQFSNQNLADFCVQAEAEVQAEILAQKQTLPDAFIVLHHKMWQQQWLLSYQSMDKLSYALQRIASRRERLQPIAETAAVLSKHYLHFEATFFDFYPQLLRATDDFIQAQGSGFN